MTKAELKKVLVVEKILGGQMTNREGAAALGLTERQVIRLKKKYQSGGAQELAHKNPGRKPKHALTEEVKERAAALYTAKYYGSNNCHFAELLEEHESLRLSHSSVRRILLSKGIKQAKQLAVSLVQRLQDQLLGHPIRENGRPHHAGVRVEVAHCKDAGFGPVRASWTCTRAKS